MLNTTESQLNERFQQDTYEYVMHIYNPIAGFIGIFLNLLTILVFRRKRMQKYSISTTMIGLAMSDSAVIAHTLFIYWYDRNHLDAYHVNMTLWCHLHGFFDLVLCGSSAWLVILVSLERWFSVLKPWIKNSYFKSNYVAFYILAIFLLSSLAHSYVPFVMTLETNQNVTHCNTKSKGIYTHLGTFSVLIVYFIPFITIGVLNAQLIKRLYLRSKNAASLSTRRNSVVRARRQTLSTSSAQVLTKQISKNNSFRNHLSCSSNDRNLSITLVIMALSYALLTMPFQIYWFYDNLVLHYYQIINPSASTFIEEWKESLNRQLARDITFQIRNLNYITNFFLYSALSKLFRREFFSLMVADKQVVLKFFGCRRSINGNLVELSRAKSIPHETTHPSRSLYRRNNSYLTVNNNREFRESFETDVDPVTSKLKTTEL
jgi:hypothetical protein